MYVVFTSQAHVKKVKRKKPQRFSKNLRVYKSSWSVCVYKGVTKAGRKPEWEKPLVRETLLWAYLRVDSKHW